MEKTKNYVCFQTNDAGKNGYPHAKDELDPYHMQILNQMDQRWTIRSKIVKFIQENIREKLQNFGFGNIFLVMTPKV